MRVNSKVLTEKPDLMGNIRIPSCPSQFKGVAENLIMMRIKLGYSVGSYHNVTELDKILTIDYWQEYDGLILPTSDLDGGFRDWFIHQATSSDLITRARRWLVEHNYIFLDADVAERAHEAGEKFSRAIKQ